MQGWEMPADLFSVEAVAPGVVEPGSVYGFLAVHRGEVFPWAELNDMFQDPIKGGQPSVPGPVVLTAMLLQSLEGLSDREVAHRLRVDLEWKAACGLGIDDWGMHPSTLVYWRKRIAESKDPDRISKAVSRVVAQCGVLVGKRRRVVDSTVIDDSVARQDAVKLMVWQIAKLAEIVPELKELIWALPGGVWYHNRSKPDIDWTSSEAKDQLVSMLVEDARQVVDWATRLVATMGDNPNVELVEDAIGLLGLVAGQDVEPAPGSNGVDGRWRIAQRTVPDRIISVVDRETRHVRKTGQNKHDGFKAHVIVEPETGIVTQAGASSACGRESSDSHNAVVMLGSEPDVTSGQVEEVLGDSAYAASEFFEAADTLGVSPVVKPRPLPVATPGGFTLDDFSVDNHHEMVTCPGGHSVHLGPKGWASFASWCPTCPLKPQCTKSDTGRMIRLGATQFRQRHHRQAAQNPEFIERLRAHRPMVERSLAWMTHPGRRTPYRGVKKTDAWWKVRAAAVNIKRLVSLGLTHTTDGWAILPSG